MTDLQTRVPVAQDEDEYWPFSDEEMDVPLSPFHVDLADYLKDVLRELYRQEEWYIGKELAIYGPNRRKNPLSPDVAVFIGVRVQKPYTFSSWYIGDTNLPPRVVFEIASEKTQDEDFNKLPHYAAWGIEEVYIYDPGIPRVWKRRQERLKGYRVQNGAMVEQQPDARGRIWSVALESWLVPNEELLLLTDADGNIRLSRGEVAETQAVAARERELVAQARELVAREREEAERTTREAEQRARKQAEAQLVAECAAREQAQVQIEAYRALLREKGINPDTL